jgi:hypothetical protein
MRLYLDANFIVYCIEGTPALKEFCLPRLREAEAHPSGSLLASRLSRVEVLVKPLRLVGRLLQCLEAGRGVPREADIPLNWRRHAEGPYGVQFSSWKPQEPR